MLISGVTGLLVSWLLIPLITRVAARSKTAPAAGMSFHHTHRSPVPRFGGVAIAGGFLMVLAAIALLAPGALAGWPKLGLIAGSLAVLAVGLRDDIKPLGAKVKLAAQVLIATGVYFTGVQIQLLKNPVTGTIYELGAWGLVATVFWLVTLTNLINLIDGIDGLAGGISLMLMCLLACFGTTADPFAVFLSIGMAGSIIGFLCFNFPPAKIYLGDGGAYFLGFLIGALTISNSNKGTVAAALIAPVFALALPIADVVLAILRRGLKGLPIFRPDRGHIHHRLVDFGFSRRGALLVLYGLSLAFLSLALVVFWSRGQLAPILFGALFLILFVSARMFGFLKNWAAVGRQLGISLQLRKETRYALVLCQWLEMEADRCETLQELWTTYLFITRKLGLSEVKLVLDTGRTVSRSEAIHRQASDFHRNRRELPLANIKAIEFGSESAGMSGPLFEHLTELAAEGWMKAVQRWQIVNQIPAVFEPALPSETAFFARGRALVANVG